MTIKNTTLGKQKSAKYAVEVWCEITLTSSHRIGTG